MIFLAAVDAMLEQHTPFSQIEAAIDGYPVPDEAKSALWLYAYSAQPQDGRRAVVAETLVAVCG
jgi:DNA-binding helix-hairpin-helix protein with protein kinase domain